MKHRISYSLVVTLALAGCPQAPSARARPDSSRESAPKPKPAPAPEPGAPPVRADGTLFGTSQLMGTQVSLNVYIGSERASDAAKGGAAMNAALAEMARIETIMSEWRASSELSRVNAAAGNGPTSISSELYTVLARAQSIHAQSNGAFDVTFHGVGHLWSFKPGSKPPTRAAIANALPLVGGDRVRLDAASQTVALPKTGMKIGLGAIAKGYAVDRASAVLRERGFPNHVVEAGGDTYASGGKGDKPWRVGVKDPGSEGSRGVLSVRDRAVVTSGDYMRYFEHNGVRYAHILDPKTGWPIPQRRSPKSVTLLAETTMDADALCTAVAVMGVGKGMEFVESQPGVEAIVITQDDNVRISPGLSDIYAELQHTGDNAPL